jgi:alkylhydroperoxidase family enzyme
MDAASELRRLEESEGRSGSAVANPRMRAFFECWLDTFLFEGAIDARLREQAILRIMWRRGRAYEWGNHYRLAVRAGLTDDEVLQRWTDWEVDWDNAKQAHTPNVRGWERLPVVAS